MGGTDLKGCGGECPGEGRKPPVIAVCGVKNSGKTTLLARLVGAFAKKGWKVAVVKRDGHDFSCDVPGTDSFKLKEAGAYGTAVVSSGRVFLHKTETGETERELFGYFPEADLIFLEGGKDSAYPKIEVIRKEVSSCPVSDPEGRFLIVTDRNPEEYEEPVLSFANLGQIITRIERFTETGLCNTIKEEENYN